MKTIISCLLLMVACQLYGQQTGMVSFEYDDCGNRVKRTIHMKSQVFRVSDTTSSDNTESGMGAPIEKVEEYTDMIDRTDIRIYPNPTRGNLTVSISSMPPDKASSIALYDIHGREIFRKDNAWNDNKLDISKEPLGTYILRISIGTESTSWKIIKH